MVPGADGRAVEAVGDDPCQSAWAQETPVQHAETPVARVADVAARGRAVTEIADMATAVRAPVYLILAAAVRVATVVEPPVVAIVTVAVVMPLSIRAAAVVGTLWGTETIAARVAQPFAVILVSAGMNRAHSLRDVLQTLHTTEEELLEHAATGDI